jgi:cell division protease FtsH
VGDDVLLGSYLSGGIQVSCRSTRRLAAILTWLPAGYLGKIIQAAGLEDETRPEEKAGDGIASATDAFALPGRPALEAFFREHVIDIVQQRDRYRALGIDSPSAMVLHGPPGCGKTFAVERLVEYLGWPIYQIASGTVGSPYIHETGRKVAELFAKALDHAPSVIVIDEMESFLADREQGVGGGGHRVEEVAEFLRRIPEAVKGGVLIIGMTNRVEMIDEAILRRGRFDHIVKVGMPTEKEVRSLLDSLVSLLPTDAGLQTASAAARLAGRPLSDAAFVVREAGRLAARAGKDRLDQEALEQALSLAPARDSADAARPRIGFA